MTVFQRVCQLLDDKGAAYSVLRHAPVYTSEEAAAVRGTLLSSGAKALVCKADDQFLMFVLPADRKLASKAARVQLGAKSLRFATREEVFELTSLVPGSIPPFGSLFGLVTWCDVLLAEEATINFNAGDHSISLSMTFADYIKAEAPRSGRFSQD